MGNKRIWISWSYQRRSYELAKAFSAEYEFFENLMSTRLQRYLLGIPRTIALLHRERPRQLFVQNPSLILASLAVILKPLYRYKLINDLHTPYIDLGRLGNTIFWALQRFCIKHADITIVTNERLKSELGSDSIHVLPDKIPTIVQSDDRELEGEINILFVCTFADDEPFEEVRRAAGLIRDGIHIYVSGNYEKAGWSPDSSPSNFHLMGYLPASDYDSMLRSVDIVMTLTTQPNCLVCGAYEGVAATKPLILSNQLALREYFSNGAIFVENNSHSIAAGIDEVVAEIPKYESGVVSLKTILNEDWARRFDEIQTKLSNY